MQNPFMLSEFNFFFPLLVLSLGESVVSTALITESPTSSDISFVYHQQ